MDPVTLAQPARIDAAVDPRMSRTREEWLWAVEQQRRGGVEKRRRYYTADQFDEANDACLDHLASDAASERDMVRARATEQLPEHLRLHEYSTQIQEAIDYIADRLTSDWAIQATDKEAQKAIEAALDHSPVLSGTVDDNEVTFLPVVVDAMVAGDTPVLLRWDPLEGCCWLDCWESEAVHLEFDEPRMQRVVRAEVREQAWRLVGGESRSVELRREWVVESVFDLEGIPTGQSECVEKVWWQPPDGGEETLLNSIPWGVPVVPWAVIRAKRIGLRSGRGASLIKKQTMRAADRFNAVEQVSWLIARYNSHGNLVVVGDQASLQARQEGKIHKDVADALLFPGGTAAFTISLPTDPQMVEHQRNVLLEQMFGAFGLQRLDMAQIQSIGQVSGYALEIVNQRSTGTFGRLRSQLGRDVKELLNLLLDCHAWWSSAPELTGAFAAPLAEGILDDWMGLPQRTFSDRSMQIRMGSGYVVDKVMLRDDVIAGQISLEERWRQEGRSEKEIDLLREELAAENEKKAQRQVAMFAAVPDSGRYQPQSGGTVAKSGAES